MKRIIVVASMLILSLMLCAFGTVSTLELSNGSTKIDVAYISAQATEDILTLDLKIDAEGVPYEIIKNIDVRTSGENPISLKLESCVAKDGNLVYTYNNKNIDITDELVIEPPVMYTPVNIEKVEVPLSKNNIAKTAKGTEWFNITSVKIEDFDEEQWCITTALTPKNDTMPRFPVLNINGNSYGAMTVMHFDENGQFELGEFIFYVPKDEISTIAKATETATITIADALERLEPKKFALTSNVKTISVAEASVIKW